VALFTLVSPRKPRSSHEKDAARFRDTLKASLEKGRGTRVVLSRPVPATIVPKDACDRIAEAMPYCRQEAQRAGADAVCVVHFKDVGGYLTVGLGVPKLKLSSIRGECDYDLIVVEPSSGQELLCSSGKWSDSIDLAAAPQLPSPTTLAEGIAQVLQPASAANSSAKPAGRLALSDSQKLSSIRP
jgi:hypothetical protein